MEIRDIEIFLTLAEELHFGRAADRLHVSQARVSQAINQQERRLGGALFDRTNRRQIRLTPLPPTPRRPATGLRGPARQPRTRPPRRPRLTHVLRVGMLPINTYDLRPYWGTLRARHPQWQLQIQHASFVDPFAGLRRGDLDMLVCWLPVEEPDLTVGPVLFADPRVLAVAARMRRFWSRPDIAYLPVRDIDALRYALVWRTETENDPIRALARVAADIGTLAT
ncbi:LysR family transcriptional regulator [Nonomuraea sp. NPDC050153]|uniref:LysR family transcriptional regulator n=1 Tax=Nonomuraea sp. NPDC050153 TaxID=3364359 RepID=UPI00379ACDB9